MSQHVVIGVAKLYVGLLQLVLLQRGIEIGYKKYSWLNKTHFLLNLLFQNYMGAKFQPKQKFSKP